MNARSSREDSHELFVGLEWLSKGELHLERSDVVEVGSERSKVVWVVPLPGGCLIHGNQPNVSNNSRRKMAHPLVVVVQNPGQSLNVLLSDPLPELFVGRLSTELLPVIAILISRFPEPINASMQAQQQANEKNALDKVFLLH